MSILSNLHSDWGGNIFNLALNVVFSMSFNHNYLYQYKNNSPPFHEFCGNIGNKMALYIRKESVILSG